MTYVVSAAPKNKLEHYDWKYPFLGKMPYKGFFHPEGAQEEAQRLRKKNLDVFVRGVSAYSTLGWFRDPILSSMLAYKDYDLVNTIIHETVHATIYIKGEADFNESLATFIGNKGTEEFYRALEGPDSSTVLAMQNDLEDERLFSDFISREMKDLKTWYERNADTLLTDEVRQARFKRIQARFKEEIRPKLRLKDSYKGFETAEINNARLLAYKMYIGDLAQFEAVFQKLDRDFARMMAFCKSLESSRDPKQDLLRAALAKP